MAGHRHEFAGEAWVAEGARVGYLAQEPQLDPAKSRARERDGGRRARSRRSSTADNELAANYSDETADEMTRLQDEIEAKGLWDLDSKVDQAMDALRCPPDERRRGAAFRAASGAASRSASCCWQQPDLLLLDEPTNHLDAEIGRCGSKGICATIRARS